MSLSVYLLNCTTDPPYRTHTRTQHKQANKYTVHAGKRNLLLKYILTETKFLNLTSLQKFQRTKNAETQFNMSSRFLTNVTIYFILFYAYSLYRVFFFSSLLHPRACACLFIQTHFYSILDAVFFFHFFAEILHSYTSTSKCKHTDTCQKAQIGTSRSTYALIILNC